MINPNTISTYLPFILNIKKKENKAKLITTMLAKFATKGEGSIF